MRENILDVAFVFCRKELSLVKDSVEFIRKINDKHVNLILVANYDEPQITQEEFYFVDPTGFCEKITIPNQTLKDLSIKMNYKKMDHYYEICSCVFEWLRTNLVKRENRGAAWMWLESDMIPFSMNWGKELLRRWREVCCPLMFGQWWHGNPFAGLSPNALGIYSYELSCIDIPWGGWGAYDRELLQHFNTLNLRFVATDQILFLSDIRNWYSPSLPLEYFKEDVNECATKFFNTKISIVHLLEYKNMKFYMSKLEKKIVDIQANVQETSTNISIANIETYKNVCSKAASDDIIFNEFKSIAEYRQILEHTDCHCGFLYLEYFLKFIKFNDQIEKFKSNDSVGNPIKCEYVIDGKSYGSISPTTLRYMKVLCELVSLFGDLNNFNVVELGGGYGGQSKIIQDVYNIESYQMIDLPEAERLQQKYLTHFNYKVDFNFKDQYDLFISNYAYTEICKKLQDKYFKDVIMKSKRGYITCNFISTGYGVTSYTKDDLLSMFSPLKPKIIDEYPLTHGENFIIVWGFNP